MSLARVHDPLSLALVRRLGDAGGPRADHVADELDNIITAFNGGFGVFHADVNLYQTAANTTETDFATKVIPANTFASDGDMMLLFARSLYAANANTKRMRIYWESTAFFDTAAFAFNGLSQFTVGLIYRETSTILKTAFANFAGTTINPAVSITAVTPTSFTVDRTLKITGQNGAAVAGDVIQAGLWLLKGSV